MEKSKETGEGEKRREPGKPIPNPQPVGGLSAFKKATVGGGKEELSNTTQVKRKKKPC